MFQNVKIPTFVEMQFIGIRFCTDIDKHYFRESADVCAVETNAYSCEESASHEGIPRTKGK